MKSSELNLLDYVKMIGAHKGWTRLNIYFTLRITFHTKQFQYYKCQLYYHTLNVLEFMAPYYKEIQQMCSPSYLDLIILQVQSLQF